MRALAFLMLATAAVIRPAAASETILFAAGSLKGALTEAAQAFAIESGHVIKTEFAASGLLRERIEKGERVHVFASANMKHPEILAAAGKAGPVRMFARNRLCAITQPGFKITSATLLEAMLDPKTKLGISTPKADPSGDYALLLFEKAEKSKPGAEKTLKAKALQLTGGPTSPKPPAGRNTYAWVMAEKKADVFLTYCTNAIAATKEFPGLQPVHIPEPLAVGADYGLTVVAKGHAGAEGLAAFILGPKGQASLTRHGFAPPVK